jgi:hypothetical protein
MKVKTPSGKEYNFPFISQYDDYCYNADMCCECSEPTDRNYAIGIVGYSTDSNGRILLLHECPKCGKKWRCHAIGNNRSKEPDYALLMTAYMLDKLNINIK